MKEKVFFWSIVKDRMFSKGNRLFYFIVIFLLILGDVFLFSISSDVRIFGILFCFAYLLKRYKLGSQATFLFALVVFLMTYILYIFSNPTVFHQTTVPPVERLAVWLYLFLVIGVIQKWRE